MAGSLIGTFVRTTSTWQSLISNLYRLLAWVYLRWLPVSPLHLVIPALFILYLPAWAMEQVPEESPAPVKIVERAEKINGTQANGFVVKRAGPNPVPPPLRILLSIPTKGRWVRAAHLLVNVAILAMTMDFTLHKYLYTYDDLKFVKLGATTSDSVKILVRYPGLEADGGAIKLLWREKPVSEITAGVWKDGPIIHLSPDKDWVGVVELKKLWPASEYQYRLAYPNSTFLEYPPSPLSFKTFPDQRLTGGTRFSFIASSGITPNFPYRPSVEPNRLLGFDLLADQLFPPCCAPSLLETYFFKTVPFSRPRASHATVSPPEALADPLPVDTPADQQVLKAQTIPADPVPEEPVHAETIEALQLPTSTHKPVTLASATAQPSESSVPAFVFLTGDLVDYSLPSPLKSLENVNTLFRRIYASSSFRKIYERIPVFNILNEIAPNSDGTNEAYTLYSGQSNYNTTSSAHENWYDFRYGDVAFFVMDTRSHRVVDPALEESEHTLLGHKQFCALLKWAANVNHTSTFKFVVSPVALSNMWGSTATEGTWGLFGSERSRVVDVLKYIPNVFVISGDRHEFAAIRYLENEGGFWEFTSGPMSSFAIPAWPFTKLHSLKSKVLRIPVNETLTKPLTIITSVTSENGTETDVEVPVLGVDGQPVNETVLVEKIEDIREEKIEAAYHAGNYKWTRFEVDTTNPEKPTVKVELSIDGEVKWSTTIQGRHVPIITSSALGMAFSGGLKGVLEKIGLNAFGKLFRSRSLQ